MPKYWRTWDFNPFLGGSKTWVLGTPCQCRSFPGTPLKLLGSQSHPHPTPKGCKEDTDLRKPLAAGGGSPRKILI